MQDCTGYYLSEAIIPASINPKYGNRLFVEFQVQYKKTTFCVHQIVLNVKKAIKYTLFGGAELVVFSYWTNKSTNNLSLYFGLIDARMIASDKE